jgi:hypothetical protein
MKELVITRKYQNKNGTEGKEYIKVGYLFETEGRQSILLKPYINFSAFQNAQGEVWVNVYDAKPKTPKTESTQSGYTLPIVDNKAVAEEGKEYAKKWKELAEGTGNTDDIPF